MGWQIGINALIGVSNYAITTALNGDNITLGGLIFSLSTGALAGFVGGSGFMNGNAMGTVAAAFGSKNFFKIIADNFIKQGLDIVVRNAINAFFVVGGLNGGYSKLSSYFNPDGKFLGL